MGKLSAAESVPQARFDQRDAPGPVRGRWWDSIFRSLSATQNPGCSATCYAARRMKWALDQQARRQASVPLAKARHGREENRAVLREGARPTLAERAAARAARSRAGADAKVTDLSCGGEADG